MNWKSPSHSLYAFFLLFVTVQGIIAATIEEARTERVLAAVETFENKMAALANIGDVGAPAAELMDTFSRELPTKLASDLSSGIADYVNQNGGVDAFRILVERAPEIYRASLPSVLPPERQQLLAISQSVARGTTQAPADWSVRKAAWAAQPRGRHGPQLLQGQLNLRQTRIRGVLQGDYGALLDLAIASSLGIDKPQDDSLMLWWGSLNFRVDQAKAMSIRPHAWESMASYRAMAEAGSTWGMIQLAKMLLPKEIAPIPSGEARSWIEKAAALGNLEADRFIKQRGLASTTDENVKPAKNSQAIGSNLTNLANVFGSTANGIAWDGEELLVSAYDGIYRSTDSTRFERWIPRDGGSFISLAKVGGRIWTIIDYPDRGRSELSAFPTNSGGKLPGYLSAAGRITGIAGEGDRLALITDGGKWSGIYTSDDRGSKWSFGAAQIPGLLAMQYGLIPGWTGPGLTYGNGRWVAIGRDANNATVAAISSDRMKWKLVPVGGPMGGMMRIVFANGRFVASGHEAMSKDAAWTVASSTDGEAWQLATLPGEKPGLVDAVGGRLYAYNQTNLFTSDDARTWRHLARHAPLDAVAMEEIGDRLVLVGQPVFEGPADSPKYQMVQVRKPNASAVSNAPDVTILNVAAALEKFDKAVLATSLPEQLGKPAAVLVGELDRMIPGKLADAVFIAAKHVMFHVGGARGYYDFMMGLPDGARLKEANAQLKLATQPQQDLIKALSTQELNRLYNRPVEAVDTRAWPAKKIPAREPKKGEGWDFALVRRALVSGAHGAAMDLQIAYGEGQSAPVDPMLNIFWSYVAEALVPDSQAKEDDKAYRAGAASGSAFSRVWLAWTLEKVDAGKHRSEIIALLGQAREGGYTPASKILAAVEQQKNGPAVAANWIKAANAASSMQVQTEIERLRTGKPGDKMTASGSTPTGAAPKSGPVTPLADKPLADIPAAEVARMVAALEKFDRQTYFEIQSYVEWGDVLAELVNALDRGPDKQLADAVFKNAAYFSASVGGAEGAARFYRGVSATRKPATLDRFNPSLRAFIEKGGTAPPDRKAEPRKKPGSSIRDFILDPNIARNALVRGRYGAAIDLGYGAKLGDDRYPAEFWNEVGDALIPGLWSESDPNRLLQLEADAGSAMSQMSLAKRLEKEKGPDAPEMLALLKKSAEGGSKEARNKLNTREQAAAATVRNGTTFTTKLREDSKKRGIELLQLNNFTGNLKAVRHINGAYHAVTDKGVVLRSKDARNWTQLFAADNASYEDITGGDGNLLLIPTEISRLMGAQSKHSWASFDSGRTWKRIPIDAHESPHYVLGKFWRYEAWLENGKTVSGFTSSTNLTTWQKNRGIPTEWLAKAPTFRLREYQLFDGRIYRHWGRTQGTKIESSTDFENWRLEFELPEGTVTNARFPVQFEVVGKSLVLGTMVTLGKGKVEYRILEPGKPWRMVVADRTYLHSLNHADGWTVLHDSADIFGGLTEATRGFERFRTLASLPRHASRSAHGPEGFVFVGDEGRVAILHPDTWWEMRPAATILADASKAKMRGDYAAMDRLIAESRLDEPNSEKAFVLEARAGFERNQADKLTKIIEDGLKQHPNSLELRGIRAFLRVSNSDQLGAKADADAVLAKWEWQPEAALARFMLTSGRDRNALDAALVTQTDFTAGYTVRAMFRHSQGDKAGALADLQAAEKSRLEHAEFQRSLAAVYEKIGATEDARRCLATAERLIQSAMPKKP